jgi:hypothetical protein
MRAMSAVGQLKEQLAGHDDADILASIESETNALELMDRLIEAVVADEALVEMGTDRLRRIEARANKRRAILARMMEEIGERIERPAATLSIGAGRQRAIITDEKAVPETYFRSAVDKMELLRALKDGPVPGAEISNGPAVLRISTR